MIKFAETDDEIKKAQKLRYRVFNLEQGKGLETALSAGIDRDEFDEHCIHLIIFDKNTGEAVGTYRMHFGVVARSALGLYSSREYELHGLDRIMDDCLEVGRSCVSPEYRNGAVVALLWAGIAEVVNQTNIRYLLGCVSLENTDPAVGWALYEYFQKKNLNSEELSGIPHPQFILPLPPREEIDAWLRVPLQLHKEIPPLFKGYLRLGTTICGEPAMDNEFGTIDFMILLDTRKMPERYWRHFFTA
ncbi:MAG: GNAT family N-acetyltransferase [Victivallales bacterium]|nr:GNAT family N-acetyltransferase [Victivallales bacterium]